MMNAIQLDDKLAVTVVLEFDEVRQLTPQGIRDVLRTKATIYNAKGLEFLSEGVSIKAPEDADDQFMGVKLAIQRALDGANFVITKKEQRRKVYDAMIAEEYRMREARAVQSMYALELVRQLNERLFYSRGLEV